MKVSEIISNLKNEGLLAQNHILSKKHEQKAGKILKNHDEASAREFILEKAKDKQNCPNFAGGSIHCNIVAQSRPFNEWEISKTNVAIQEIIFSMHKDKIPQATSLSREPEQKRWLLENKLSYLSFGNVQGLGLIFKNAIKTYNGVEKKVKNKNKKNQNKIDYKNSKIQESNKEKSSYEEISAFDDNGFLLQKPSPNHSIFCYQQVSPKPFVSEIKDKINLPEKFVGYDRAKNKPIISPYPIDRLNIPNGEPGHIPEWQRHVSAKGYGISKNKHKRMRLSKKIRQNDPILGIIKICDDWVVFDMRALLRVNHWREISKNEYNTAQDLLSYFTGDPIIHPERNAVIFRYKPEYGIRNSKPLDVKSGFKYISDLVDKNKSLTIATIDVGQINPISVGVYEITKENNTLIKKELEKFSTPDWFNKEIKSYRTKSDELKIALNTKAITHLSQEQQQEIEKSNNITAKQVADIVCDKYKLSDQDQDLPWGKMGSNSHFIANKFIQQGGDKSLVSFGNEKLKSDFTIYKENKPKWSEETRKIYNEKLWDLQRNSPEYKKLSVNKKQLCRRLANDISEKYDIIGIEKLVKVNNFFSGSGKRELGWHHFLQPKKENRWWINAIHGALFDLAQNKGKKIILLPPMCTSITCPKCKHCDDKNRNTENRELFKCTKCGIELNADKDVAVDNLATVAITGAAMPRPRQRMRCRVA